MSFSHLFKFLSIVLAISVGGSFAAKTSYGKFRSVIGDVEHKTYKSDEWKKQPRVGTKVNEGDMIRTMIESQAMIGLPDGSIIAIEENSIVSISELSSEDGKNISTTDIKSGKIRFDVQKQANKESSFKFKTGTAVAAIRGTEGIIGSSSYGQFIASLITGQLEIQFGGNSTTINGGQTAFSNGNDITVMDLSSSGTVDLFNIIEQILSDTTLTMDSLSKLISEKNLDLEKAKQLIQESLKCDFSPLPEQVEDTTIVIKGNCLADTVEISGQKQEAKGNDMEFTPFWEADAIGAKKFAINCQVGALHLPCGQLSTYFVGLPKEKKTEVVQPEALLTITTLSPVSVSDLASATIEGTFATGDSSATLYVKMGNYTSPNLIPLSANGQFSHTINISEKKRNWSEKDISVIYDSKVLGSKSITVGLDVDKSNKAVNNMAPILTIRAADSLKCYTKLDLDNILDDEVIYSYSIDNETANVSTRYKNKTTIKQNLTSGIHKYTFSVTDLAGNSSNVSRTLGCFPPRQHTLEILGGNVEKRVRAPKPPKGYESNTIHRVLTFKITNIPDNDPSYIKMITITQNGKKTVLRPTDFLSNIFDYQLELEHNATTKVTIQVVMKNGSVLTATKSYKVQ